MGSLKLNDLLGIQDRVDEATQPLQQIINEIVAKYCSPLDDYMKMIDSELIKSGNIPTSVLEEYLLNLNSLLYWTGKGLEETTIKESMAKMMREEKYNISYNKAEGTMGDKKATASLDAQSEDIVKLCYTNALALYKHKIDRAAEMSSSIKKIITHRINELQYAGVK